MKILDINQAKNSLGEYAQDVAKAPNEPVVITENGKPVAVLLNVENADMETLSLSMNPKFIAIIERSRARAREEGGIPLEDIRRELGI